jgi:pimeloyl-ACP methyl ester carboxylesterase
MSAQMPIRRVVWPLCLAGACACVFAQSTAAPFQVELGGKPIGKADYRFEPAGLGFHLKARYTLTADSKAITAERDADLGPGYDLKSDTLHVAVNGESQTATLTADPHKSIITFEALAAGKPVNSTFALHPGTVVLNNFDPSGVQTLIYMETAHPQPDHKYWAFLVQGKGIQLPLEITALDPGEGTLNGTEIPLKHWRFKIAETEGDIWADSSNNLMEFEIPIQAAAYRRVGFALKDEADDAISQQPTPGANAVEEKSVSFTSDGLKFPAILALPKDRKGPLSVIVLVPGSGPHDADETIGPNKPFRDLAWGLAAGGIATLRYEKRTHFAPDTFRAHPDIDHEVTIDAVAALAFVSTQPEIDPKRIFLLGHSLGGTMAPVIAADRLHQVPASVRGIILLAAGALGVEETLQRQLLAQAKRQGEDQNQLDAIQKQWEGIFQTVNDPATPADQFVGAPPLRLPEAYWRSWIAQNPAAELATLGLPALVLRGTKDIQVSEGDFQVLAKANDVPGSESKEIEGLNHLMMPVTGESTGQEYFQPAHVSPDVIHLIADWIGTFH